MLLLFLSALLLILSLAATGDAQANKAPRAVTALLPLARMFGLIFSVGMLLITGIRFLNGEVGKPGSLSFRTGELEPFMLGDNPGMVRVRYTQRTWFGMAMDGQWHARPDSDGGWQYFVPSDGWHSVPQSVHQPAAVDDRDFSQDNRGYHEN